MVSSPALADMDWPWHINTDITPDQKVARRILLDRYGVYAQLSALIPVAAYWLYRLGVWVFHERQRAKPGYTAVPGSPQEKVLQTTKTRRIVKSWRALCFWLGGRDHDGSEKRVHKLAFWAWAGWLMFLSVHQTGDDYFHVTKRFGIIAASQLPVHYMLIMKHRYSPFGTLFRASHEQLNPYHRALGRVIILFIYLHAGFYLNYFLRAGLVQAKFSQLIPLLGLIAFSLLTILYTTSFKRVRTWSYRLFFVLHLSVAITLPPILFFHAPPLRLYILEALTLFLLDIFIRRLAFFISPTKIISLPSTTLLKLTIPIPASKRPLFATTAAQHIYLSIPPHSRPANTLIHEFCFNPYTISSVAPDTTSLTLVLRALSGPTSTALLALTSLPKAYPPLCIDGPYGGSGRFPDFASEYDRVLLVAGGVGATFIVPIYEKIMRDIKALGGDARKVDMIWAIRAVADASWAADSLAAGRTNIKLFITGTEDTVDADGDRSVDLDDLAKVGEDESLLSGKIGRGRPDVAGIVDEVFRKGEGERVAVLVCGPELMMGEVRESVGRWVGRGREVWFHDEGFGF